MLKEIEQLLLLQDRDQKIKMFKAELETVPLERQRIEQRLLRQRATLLIKSDNAAATWRFRGKCSSWTLNPAGIR